jgi:hypothetical protein
MRRRRIGRTAAIRRISRGDPGIVIAGWSAREIARTSDMTIKDIDEHQREHPPKPTEIVTVRILFNCPCCIVGGQPMLLPW